MGLIDTVLGLVFGNSRNVIKETAEVFRENAESGAARQADLKMAALQQFAAEFSRPKKSSFDQFIDGLNRVPRPAMALGTLGLFTAAMVDPIWFSTRMQGIALVPEPLWWLLGAVVSFYFGARHQLKGQEFQRSLAETLSRVPNAVENTRSLRSLEAPKTVKEPDLVELPAALDASAPDHAFSQNAALRDWAASRA
ncbi:MAG: holin family protein [Pseudomonadota bacterium]